MRQPIRNGRYAALFATVALVSGCEEVEAPPVMPMDVKAPPDGCVAVVSIARGSEAHVRCDDAGSPASAIVDAPVSATVVAGPRHETIAKQVESADEGAIGAFDLATSSTWPGWPASNAADGDEHTSWFSGSNDSAAHGKDTFFELRFRAAETVHHVTVLGNRDPTWPRGFTILVGKLSVFDDEGRLLVSRTQNGTGEKKDFVFDLGGLEGVRRVRFTSVRDEGDETGYGDVAIAEMHVD